MNDHSLLFRPAMVQALLSDRKTQTRRPAWRLPYLSPDFPGKPTAAQRIGVGDLIWVKENHAVAPDGLPVYEADEFKRGQYDASDLYEAGIRCRPSIHLPRRWSRLTLVVTGVKIERLQEITNADALAEGVQTATPPDWNTPRMAYRALYQSIHGEAAWEANPEVVAITFTVHKANIDSVMPRLDPLPVLHGRKRRRAAA